MMSHITIWFKWVYFILCLGFAGVSLVKLIGLNLHINPREDFGCANNLLLRMIGWLVVASILRPW